MQEEQDKYDLKWAGKGLRKEQNLSLHPRTSLRVVGTMTSRKFPPNHHLRSLACCRPASSSSTRGRVRPESDVREGCDTPQDHCWGGSGKRYAWDDTDRSPCSSLPVHNFVLVKYCRCIKTAQPQPCEPLKWVCLAVSLGQQIDPELFFFLIFYLPAVHSMLNKHCPT